MSAGGYSQPPAPAPIRPFVFPPFEHRPAVGGLELWTAKIGRRPLAHLELLTPGGGLHDPPGRSGLAALTGAVLDEGAGGRSSFEIAEAIERLGGFLSSSADWDVASIATTVLSKHLDAAFELLVSIALEPTFPEDEVERNRSRTLAEIERRRAQPGSQAQRALVGALYGDGVYGRPLLGTEESVRGLDRPAIEGFYRRAVAVGPAHLIAVGDVDAERLARRAEAAFGSRLAGLAPPAPELEPVERNRLEVVIVDRPGAAQTELRVGHVGISRTDPDHLALSVMNSLLGGKFMSRINLNLRERHGYTYGASSRFQARLERGPFVVAAAVANESAADAAREILSELHRIRDEPVSETELEDTLSYLLGVFPYTVQTIDGVASRLDDLAVYGLPDDHFQRLPERLAALTRDDLLEAARRHLDPDRAVIVAVGPADDLRLAFEPFGPVTTAAA